MNIESVLLFQIEKTSKLSKLYSQREFDKLGIDISVEQWIILKIIQENKLIAQKSIAEKSTRDPASITRTLDLLEKKELINRLNIPEDRRQYNIILTKKGEKFIHQNMPIIKSLRQQSVKGFSSEEIETLSHLLKRMQENMV